jgi:TrmH family RNA methyltransferase
MISKSELKYYSSLLTKTNRKTENKFIIEGKKSVLEGINSSYECEIIFVTNKFSDENIETVNEISASKNRIVTLKQKEFEKISDTKTPQGIAAVFNKPTNIFEKVYSFNDKLIIMLDNISDPGNLGTIIRNCDWFGIKNILLSENIVDYTNPKVIRSSMGSVFHVNLFEEIDAETLLKLKRQGYEIFCADLEGENIFTYQRNKKTILILSSESHGPSKEFLEISDKKICIPKIGDAESLNVASASAVLLAILTK